MSSKKLLPYFQSNTIIVVTSYSLRVVLHSSDVAIQHMKWSVALSEFHIVYQPRTTLKAQVFADFVAKFTHSKQNGGMEGALPPPPTQVLKVNKSANA